MSDDSKIEWTDATWNPVRGCSRVSEGCRHCYAERVAGRFSGPGMPYEGLTKVSKSLPIERRWNGTVRMVLEHLADPLRWRRPRRVFVNSMSDLFHESLTNQQIAAVFGVMAASPQHTFQVLTKRARRMREWFEWTAGRGDPTRTMVDALTTFDSEIERKAKADVVARIMLGPCRADWAPVPESERGRSQWPLPNVWIGVSVENQAAADERIPELLLAPAAVRWISAEPLLGPVDLLSVVARELGRAALDVAGADVRRLGRPALDWLVMGAESGPGARAADPAWFRGLAEQCKASGVPVFFKQGVVGGGITAGPESHAKHGGLVGLPLLDGASLVEFPPR